MTGIICLTLKYTVNTVLMNSEGSVSVVCVHIHVSVSDFRWKQSQNQRGLTFYGSKIRECVVMNT
jgi:hypothetical protein